MNGRMSIKRSYKMEDYNEKNLEKINRFDMYTGDGIYACPDAGTGRRQRRLAF